MLFRIIILVAIFVSAVTAGYCRQFKQALPGYQFSFPQDHASHEDYKTEWWYYTGHLVSKDNKRFGFELTFFRNGIEKADDKNKSPWDVKDIYLAHFALTDENNHRFHYFEKLNRAGLNTAGARSDHYYVFNENWSVEQLAEQYALKADTPGFALHLLMSSMKPPAVHGQNGVSQKASCKGCASHYYSMPRLKADGNLYIDKEVLPVSGIVWMDHEFGSNQLTSEQVGWDWYSVQLDNKSELMLYVMRRADGKLDPNSSGSIIYADGSTHHLNLADFQINPHRIWKSPQTGGKYPMDWTIKIPREKLDLTLTSSLDDQELRTGKSTGVTYWEGSATVKGSQNNKNVSGQAYVEMTGYAEKFRKDI